MVQRTRNKANNDYTQQLTIMVSINCQIYNYTIRRLVYYCFVAPFDLKDPLINIISKNGDGLDIRPDNLELKTIAGKIQQLVTHGRMKNNFEHVDLKASIAKSIKKSSRMISQYDSEGKLFATFESLHQAARSTGISVNAISDTANGRASKAGGYYWRHGNESWLDVHTWQKARQAHFRKIKGTPVSQHSISGALITQYDSIQSAAEATGLKHSGISAVIRGVTKRCGGFIWKKAALSDDTNKLV